MVTCKTFVIRCKDDIAYYRADIELTIKRCTCIDWDDLQEKELTTISLMGFLWYGRIGRPILWSAGQIQDTLQQFITSPEWITPAALPDLLQIWNKYHLNHLIPGTRRQIEALKEFDPELLKASRYDEAVKYLTRIGLYEDRGYRYGETWLCRPIPCRVLKQLCSIFEIKEVKDGCLQDR